MKILLKQLHPALIELPLPAGRLIRRERLSLFGLLDLAFDRGGTNPEDAGCFLFGHPVLEDSINDLLPEVH
jgi:hypothetical protein